MSVEQGDGVGGGVVLCCGKESFKEFFFFLSQSHLGKDQEDPEE